MKQVVCLLFLLLIVILGGAVSVANAKEPAPEIMGIRLGMPRETARARLQTMGSLEKEERKRQEVWAVKDARVSHLLIGFDKELRVRYVTAIARPGGEHISYQEVADLKRAQKTNTQGNYKFTWEVAAHGGQPGYVVMAHGRDPRYLETYSVKRVE